ncbi:hypothetical protein NKH77_27520 [Streptomyces sp. M19]
MGAQPAGRSVTLADADLRAAFARVLPDVTDADVTSSRTASAGTRSTRGSAGRRPRRRPRRAGPPRRRPRPGPRAQPHRARQPVDPRPPRLLRPRHHRGPAARSDGVPGDGGRRVVALGRDPFFPPWPDVVQLNAFSRTLRALTTETLTRIGALCDGVRCDMAMLVMNDVFARTWGGGPGARRWRSSGRGSSRTYGARGRA